MATYPNPAPSSQVPAPDQSLRIVVLAILEKSHTQSDQFHREARGFRNRIVVTSLIAFGAGSLLLLSQAVLANAVIIPRPPNADGLARWELVLLIMGFGSFGALLSTIPAMAAVPTLQSPFNFPLQQAYLKIILGSLTAVIGVVLIGGTDVTTGPRSLEALLGLATAFGAAQQAVTQYLDRKAGKIIESGP